MHKTLFVLSLALGALGLGTFDQMERGFVTSASAQANEETPTKLLYYSWDTPTPAQALENIAQLHEGPFNAFSFRSSASAQIFTHAPLPSAPFEQDIENLQEINSLQNSGKLADSFLRMQINAEDGWDWTSEGDWAAFEANLRNYARTAKEGGLEGILFDPEPYEFNVWNYETQPARESQSFEALEAKARERGADFVNILREEYPGITLFSLMMFSQRLWMLDDDPDEALIRKRIREDTFHGLWYGFANGMIDALDADITLIDGNEPSYYYLSGEDFDWGVAQIYGRLLDAFVDKNNIAKYRAQVEVANAAYVDGVLNLFNSPRFIGYYFADDDERARFLEFHLFHALRSSDAYTWVYAEDLRWWTRENIPSRFVEVLQSAAAKGASGADVGFDTAFIAQAKNAYDSRVRIGGTISPNVPEISFELAGVPNSACGEYNDGGNYTCTFPANSTVTVTPTAEGVAFEPSSRSYDLRKDALPEEPFAQDYAPN